MLKRSRQQGTVSRCLISPSVSAMEYHHLIFGILALLSCINAESFLGSGYETVYDYVGDVRAGSNFPAEFVSQFGIKAKLNIQYVDSNHAIFKFNDVSYQVSTGPLAEQEYSKAKFIPAPVESASIIEPFQVNYDGGKVKSVVTMDEPEWSVNMKKAVASIFQLDVQNLHFEKPYSFVTEEPTLYGECTVGYTIQPKGAGYVDVLKSQEYGKCKNMPYRHFTNEVYESCPFDFKDDSLLLGSTRYYKLLTGRGRIEVKEIFSQSVTAAVPFHGRSDDQTIFVRQNFTLLSLGPIKEALHFTPKHENNLKYAVPHFYNEVGTIGDLTGGHYIMNKDLAMEMVHKTLGEFVDAIKMTKEPEQYNNQVSQRLLYYFGKLDQDCFAHCFEKYANPTTSREKSLRSTFIEVAAQVGSKASILFIRDTILNQKVPEVIAMDILRLVPFYVRDPSVALLHEYEKLLTAEDMNKQTKKNALISISNFVFLTYKHVHDIEIINSWAEKFYKSFKDETSYGCKLNYLNALINLEEGKVFQYLKEIIADKTYYHHLRYIALWGTENVAMKDHVKSYDLYWPIFSNQDEKVDMRAAAMKLIMITEPTFDRFISVFWFMQAETRSQLYYFYYTGLESLTNTAHPCFKKMGHHAERLFRYAKKPVTSYLFTGDYLTNYMDPKHSLGGHTILSLIGDPHTGTPNSIYISEGGYYGGYSHEYNGVLVKLSGVVESIKKQMTQFKWDTAEMADLQKIFSNLQIKPGHLEDFHIEFIFYTNKRVVATHFYNKNNYQEIFKDFYAVENSTQGEFEFRHHSVIFESVHEYVQPTDIGLPAIWNMAFPYSFSIDANLTEDLSGPRFTRKNAVEIRYGRYGGHSLSFYNPFGGMWQGARRMHSHVYTLPIHNHLSIDFAQKLVKFAVTRDPNKDFNLGMFYHVRTQVYVNDYAKTNALHESCPTCTPYVTVHAPGKVSREYNMFDYDSSETGVEYKMDIFDCDQPHTPYDFAAILYNAFDTHELNYGHNPFGHFYLGVQKLHTTFTYQPAVGSCGVMLKAIPSEKYPYTQLEGVLHFISEDVKEESVPILFSAAKYILRGSVTLKGDDVEHTYHTFDLNAFMERNHDFNDNHLSIKMTHTAPQQKEFKFCMDVKTKYPEIPADMYVVRKESEEDVTGKLSMMWGESVDGRCPTDGSGFKATMTASVLHVEKAEHDVEYPYNVCHHDAEEPEWKGKHLTPITNACVEAAMDSTTLRKFAGYVQYFNIPDNCVTYGNKFMNFVQTAGEYHLISYKEEEKTTDVNKSTFVEPQHTKGKHGEMKYVVEFEKKSPFVDVHMSWEGDEHEQHYDMKYDTFGFKPFFMSSRFFLLNHFVYGSGLYSSCVVTPSSVQTYDNDTYHYHSSHCYTLVSGDCSEPPMFAVFTKKVEGPYDLAVKFYSAGHYMEIIPNAAGEFDVNINGHPVTGGLQDGYQYPENSNRYHYKIAKKDNFVNVDSLISFVEIDYTGYSVVIHAPVMYRGYTCGLCGDFNNDEVYFERMGEISHSCHKTHYDAVDGDYLGYRYTYRGEECPEITEEMTKHVECIEHHH